MTLGRARLAVDRSSVDREEQAWIARPGSVKLGASPTSAPPLTIYPPISTSKPFVTVSIHKNRRPGRQAPDYTNK
jgi:hypothetical protein